MSNRNIAVGRPYRLGRLLLSATLAVGVLAVISVGTSSATTKAKESVINIGNIGTYSGDGAGINPYTRTVLKAWVAYTNKHGGIGGHQIKLYALDDAGNATTALQDAKTLVTTDHVVAIVAEESIQTTAFASYVQSKGVPVIGGQNYALAFLASPDFFAVGANVLALSYGELQMASAIGPNFGILYCAEVPECAAAPTVFGAIGQSLGVKIGLAQATSASATSYVPTCQAIIDSGVQSYAIETLPASIPVIANACKTQGVTALPVSEEGVAHGDMADVPGLQGLEATTSTAPWMYTKYNASVALYDKVIGNSLGINNGPDPIEPWVAGQVFAAALKAAGVSAKTHTIRAATVLQGLYKLPANYTTGGLTAPLHFVKGQANLENCYFKVSIANNKYVAPQGDLTACAPSAVVNAIVKALG